MKTTREKRGRPKSKMTRQEYLKNHLLVKFLIQRDKIMEDLVSRGLIDSSIAEDMTAVYEENYFNFLLKQKESVLVSKSVLKKFFSAGAMYGIHFLAEKAITQILEKNEDLFNATMLLKSDLEAIKRLQGYSIEDLNTDLPNDLLRKMRKSKYPKKDILRFRRMIREFDGRPYLDIVAKKFEISIDQIRSLIVESNRQKFPVRIGRDKSGKEFLMVD